MKLSLDPCGLHLYPILSLVDHAGIEPAVNTIHPKSWWRISDSNRSVSCLQNRCPLRADPSPIIWWMMYDSNVLSPKATGLQPAEPLQRPRSSINFYTLCHGLFTPIWFRMCILKHTNTQLSIAEHNNSTPYELRILF